MKASLLLTAALLAGSLSFAADTEHKEESTTDTSKNPITGTVTEKKKTKMKKKDGKDEKTVEVTEKTKTHKDGHTETSTEVKTDSEKH